MQYEALSTVLLSSFGLRREPPRPKEHREPGYEDKYDFDTLFYDLFLSADGRHVMAVHPPFLNCASDLSDATFRLEPGGAVLPAEWTDHKLGGVLRLPLPAGCVPQSISLKIGSVMRSLPVSRSGCAMLNGRRTIFTLSKDNSLSWIRDWATYNVHVHGADAVLFYDNGSSAYDLADVARTLEAIEGLRTVVIVPWRFRFGPGTGPNGEWDSNYCQHRAIEHARWRYCAEAAAFLNSDIDEMVVAEDGGSVFVRLLASGLPCITYGGWWVSAVRPRWRRKRSVVGQSAQGIRHSDCLYLEKEPRYPNKWAAVPRLCGPEVHWSTHGILGFSGAAAQAAVQDQPMIEDIAFRHCRQIGTSWKYMRDRVPAYRPTVHTYDRLFARTLARAFPERAIFRQGGLLRRLRDLFRQL